MPDLGGNSKIAEQPEGCIESTNGIWYKRLAHGDCLIRLALLSEREHTC